MHHAECFAQLALFGPAREVLCQDAAAIAALEAVAEIGLSAETCDFAHAALLALSSKELQAPSDGEQTHVMLSCKFTSNVPFLVICGCILTDCLCLQTSRTNSQL